MFIDDEHPSDRGIGVTLSGIADVIGAVVATFEPERYSGADARILVERFSRIERLSAAGKALAARRVAETHAWRDGAARSAADWLGRATGTSAGQAAQTISTSQQLKDQPEVDAALRAGTLSSTQAAEIAHATRDAPEAALRLIDRARTDSVQGLRQDCQAVRAESAGEDAAARRRRIHAKRHLRSWIDQEGAGRLDARMTADALARLRAQLAPFERAEFGAARRQGRTEPNQAYALDALLDAVDAASSGAGSPSDDRGPLEDGPAADEDRAPGGDPSPADDGAPDEDAPAAGEDRDPGEDHAPSSGTGSPSDDGGPVKDRPPAGADRAPGEDHAPRSGVGSPSDDGGPVKDRPPAGEDRAPGEDHAPRSGVGSPSDDGGPVEDRPPAGEDRAPGDSRPAGAAARRSPPGDAIGPDAGSSQRSGAVAAAQATPGLPGPPGRGTRRVSRPPATIIVRIDHAALVRGVVRAGECSEIDGVGPVPVDVVRAMMADAFLAAVVTDGVDIRSVAHLGRSVTATQRTALYARDPECVVPGCHVRTRLEIDHVQGWAATRVTRLDELARLCHYHHALKTHEGWILRGPPGHWTFRRKTDHDDAKSARPPPTEP
jgi:hypothetical protein